MADLPSILGGMAQGFLDFGKSAVDLFGTGGAAVGDLVDTIRTGKVSTKNQDDFRKWLYNTDSVEDAAAKGLGTALNGVQTVSDYIPGIGAVTRNPLFNAGQGALGGLADEFKMYGKDYDLGRAGQRAAVGAGGALASTGLADALKGSSNTLLSSNTLQGLARGATGGAITGGGYAAIDGGDVMQSALQGAGTGALIGGATGAFQDFKPAKTYDMALTDDERAARIANAQKQIDDIGPVSRFSNNPDDIAKRARISELQGNIRAYQNGYDTAQDYTDAMAAKRANRPDTQAGTTQGQAYAPNMGEMEYGAPVQDGYTRLYRGMTQEFDPQYNRNAMDNMNGYESWTDNYDLANRYGAGKYVYSVDVPTSRIANSLYDENPNSATYGDRNFIASIEKPAGLDGITGNEYLLNTNDELRSGLTYNRVNAPQQLEATLADADMAVNNPRYLTDENGNPRTFYHGSPNKNITEFDINQAGKNTSSGEHALYFTDSPEVADEFSYERLPSDSMFVDNRGAKGRVYPVNLEMNNPLDLDNLTDAQIRELWQYASPLGQLDGQEKFIKNLTEFRDAAHNGQLTKTLLDLDKLANSPYDGFTARMYPNQANQAREYAVFDNSKVKMLEDVLANDDMAVNNPKLTPEQEAYFKDSVIRDENGNLIPMYHGTRGNFTVFGDNAPSDTSNSHASVGNWFTPTKEGAKNFAESIWYGDGEPTVMETYLNVKNPKVYETVDNSKAVEALTKELREMELNSNKLSDTELYSKNIYDASMAQRMLEQEGKDTTVKWLSGKGYGDEKAAKLVDEIAGLNEQAAKKKDLLDKLSELRYSDAYQRFKTDIYKMDGQTAEDANVGGTGMALNDRGSIKKYVDKLKSEGYDGIIIKGTRYDADTMGGPNDQYVVFDSNQIKSTKNLKPTSNPDIYRALLPFIGLGGLGGSAYMASQNNNKEKEVK